MTETNPVGSIAQRVPWRPQPAILSSVVPRAHAMRNHEDGLFLSVNKALASTIQGDALTHVNRLPWGYA